MIDPNAVALLTAGGKYGGIFPQPTSGINFVGGNNSPTNLREEIARVDHTFTSKFSVFGHWISEQVAQTYGTTQWSGDNSPSVGEHVWEPLLQRRDPYHLRDQPDATQRDFVQLQRQPHCHQNINLFTAPSSFQFNRLFSGPNVDNRIPSINLNGVTGRTTL